MVASSGLLSLNDMRLRLCRYAMSLAGNKLKMIYGARTPADAKTIHVLSSGLKALLTWHFMRTAQVYNFPDCYRFYYEQVRRFQP